MKNFNNYIGNSWLSWSSGKDSAYVLYILNKNYKNLNINKLLCTINGKYDRISLHAIRTELLLEQSKQLNIQLYKCIIPDLCSHDDYNQIMNNCIKQQQSEQNKYIIFGDIYLENVKKYRVEKMQDTNIKCIFPIFENNISKQKIRKLAESIINVGIKAIIVCIDLKKLDKKFIGRIYDLKLIDELELLGIDVCGENGEFHTFVYEHPMFQEDIKIKKGNIKVDENFCFIDIMLDK